MSYGINRRITPIVKAVGMFKKFSPWGLAIAGGGMLLDHVSDKIENNLQKFNDHWFNRLGYEGMPRLEMYKGEDAEAEFDRDSREYWDTHPDNLSIY